ncbi:MAG: hypothetical protein ABSA44_13560 [Bacteroidota bacterium]|jgi:DNA polymerase III sliding clamp (beta) subunit (PCNA family)
MVIAIKGAVIIKTDKNGFSCYNKCEKCGFVDTSLTINDYSDLRPGQSKSSGFSCSHCGQYQEILIQGAG